MEAAYFKAAIPEPFQILGLSLRPLSLGRYRLMQRFGCAFVSNEDTSASMSDLILGCAICASRVDDFLEDLESGRLESDIKRWGKKVFRHIWIAGLPFIGKWWRKNKVFNAVEKIQLFQNYIKIGSAVPLYWSDSEGEGGGDWSQGMEVTLRGQLGWTAEEINEAPLSKALADYFAYAESQGLLKLMTPEEIAYIEASEKEASRGA